MAWWNISYPFRRHLSLVGPSGGIEAQHPITHIIPLSISIDSGKVRNDLLDLVVLYYSASAATPTWSVIPTNAQIVGDNIQVQFPLQADIEEGEVIDNSYYIYYGNSDLEATPTYLSYTPDPWPVELGFADAGISYTRPGEHWNLGISNGVGAKATLAFYGNKVRIIGNKGANWGIAEIQIDDGAWQDVDYFAVLDSFNVEIFSVTLNKAKHTIRVRDAGKHNPSAYSSSVNIVRFEYSKGIESLDLGEEINDFEWSSSIGGT